MYNSALDRQTSDIVSYILYMLSLTFVLKELKVQFNVDCLVIHYWIQKFPPFKLDSSFRFWLASVLRIWNYNRQQNLLRHFTLKGLSDILLPSNGENKASPPLSPSSNVVLLFELPIENNKHPNFEWRGGERGVDSFILWSSSFGYDVSTIFTPIAA